MTNPMGLHVGNLKFIFGLWKFKAIGYDDSGEVIPGGGPLTEQHNTVFSSLDIEHIKRVLSNAATPNVCAAENAKLPGSKPERCWCLDAVFTTDVMNQVPDAAKGKACICAKFTVGVA